MEIKNKLTVTRGEAGGNNGGKRGRVVKEHVQRTLAQSQSGVGSRMGGGDSWGEGE